MIASKSIEFRYWGLTTYAEAQALQESAWDEVKAGHPGIILGGEVEFVVTQGVRANPLHILSPDLQPVKTKRGGETTLHSPGQLLIYPVISLRERGWGVKHYIQTLLEISSQTLNDLGAKTYWQWNPLGIWSDQGKVGFCGVQVKSGITQHGLALNLENDLDHFKKITSCGLTQARYDKPNLAPALTFQRCQAPFCLRLSVDSAQTIPSENLSPRNLMFTV